MLFTVLTVLGVSITVLAVVVCIYHIVKAPEGIEDENGFRMVESRKPATSRYFAARAKERPAAKPYKAHLPVS
jgi:hypothetical protein